MRGDADGEAIVMIGITQENIERLLQGQPAEVPLDKVNIPGLRLMLMYGQTERHIIRIFEQAGLVAPGTASDMPEVKDPAEQYHFNRTDPDGGSWRPA